MSFVSVIFEFMGTNEFTIPGYDLSSFSFGLFDYNLVRGFSLAWFIIAMISRSNRLSYSTGVIFENLESKMGKWVNFCTAAVGLLANDSFGVTVQAASMQSQPLAVAKHGFNALVCFLLLISILIIYYFIRFLFFFIDIILLPVCSLVPWSALVIEALKTLGIIGLFFVAILLFKKAYITIRYFRNIYVRPFLRKFLGYDSEIPLVMPKAPKKVKLFVGEFKVDILIPVYILRKISGIKHIHRHDRWWFVSTEDKKFICKPCFLKNDVHYIELNNDPEKKMFIKKSLRFFEIFNLKGGEENVGRSFRKVHKKIHVVFSKEYYYCFEKIKAITTFIDYTEYAKQIKQGIKLSKKEQREQKRQERLEAKEEKRIARQKNKSLANID